MRIETFAPYLSELFNIAVYSITILPLSIFLRAARVIRRRLNLMIISRAARFIWARI